MTAANAVNFAAEPGSLVVSPTAGQGQFTTIASALAVAVSGNTIYIRPGTYTENLTLVAGVNLAALDCDALTPNVTIVGKNTFTSAGSVSISGIRLQTNSDFFLAVTGSAASIVNLQNCFLNCSNNTGISFTSSDAGAQINILYCQGNVATTGITVYSMTSTGTINGLCSTILNSGAATTASNNSAGTVSFRYVRFFSPVTTSSSGVIDFAYVKGSTGNTASITTAGTGTSTVAYCVLNSGSASTISVGSGTTVQVYDTTISSSNTNAITGAGTLNFALLTFQSSSSTINTTTQTPYVTQTGDTTFTAIGNSLGTVTVNGANDAAGANLKMIGDGATTPNKTLRVLTGNFEIVNSAYAAAIFRLTDAGNITLGGWQGGIITPTYGGTGQNFSASTGLISLSSGTASATATPSVTSITLGGGTALANYVEGTWTPGVAFGGGATGVTYTSQLGNYTRIGNIVFICGRIILSSKGSDTGALTITGLPITATTPSARYVLEVTYFEGLTLAALYTQISLNPVASGTTMNVFKSGSATAAALVSTTTDTIANNFSILFSGFYTL